MSEAEVVVDAKGRIALPSKLREKLRVRPGDRIVLRIGGGRRASLERAKPRLKSLRAQRTWGKEAFPCAGEALFGGQDTARR